MSDMPAPLPDQPLVKSLLTMYERGDLDAIENVRQQQIDETREGNGGRREKLLARFEEARAEAYDRYQTNHEASEKDRIKAAKALAKQHNDAAPSADDVPDLYRPMQIETTLDPEGSFVEEVRVTKWELDPKTRLPRLVEVDPKPGG